ncbi:MAG: hypothetical protein GKR93_09025 [Gammaproteobacteria bacterium]|nr:hypothetical protein [Gammaproteobacteria bacterium]
MKFKNLVVYGSLNYIFFFCSSLVAVENPNNVINPVADDVLFLVLAKMAIFNQHVDGEVTLRDYHFVAEIMPKTGRRIVGGTLTSAAKPNQVLTFNNEGLAFLAHGARVQNAEELHKAHPDGVYIFDYETQSGNMNQFLTLKKRVTTEDMPRAARVSLLQAQKRIDNAIINAEYDWRINWEPMPGNTKAIGSELADLIFVLGFDCHGKSVIHSGRPYQGDYLTFEDRHYIVPGKTLEPGLDYTLIVEQATADVETYQGVPGISTYATLTFFRFKTSGEAEPGRACPVTNK